MATRQPSKEPTQEERMHMTDSFSKIIHNISIGTLIVAPLLMALPPRKLDLYTFFLSSAMVASANQLVKERTGAGIIYQLPGARLPSYAVEYQERIRAQNTASRILEESVSAKDTLSRYSKQETSIIGSSTQEGWKEQRLREEQEKLDQGEGYGSMIMDQIWDVWNQAEHKAEEVKEKDEQALKSKKKES